MIDRKWEDAIVRAAAEASRLQPLATIFFFAAVLLVLGEAASEPLHYLVYGETGEPADVVAAMIAERLLHITPVLPLLWALWETRAYLGRLARGEVWGPATMLMLGRVGDALLWSAGLSVFVAPTLSNWVNGDVNFDFNLNAAAIALAGLGLLLTLVARVVRNVVDVAATLKAENDQIV